MADQENVEIISISIRPRALSAIDAAARARGLSRSRFMTLAGLLAADEILEDEEQPRPEPEDAPP